MRAAAAACGWPVGLVEGLLVGAFALCAVVFLLMLVPDVLQG